MKSLLMLMVNSLIATNSWASIQGASNISGDKVIVSVQGDKSPTRTLVDLNLKTAAKNEIILPKELGAEEIMGMFLFPERLVLISQWTAGDGKKPHVHEYDLAKKTWSKPTELDCLSFDTVKVSGNEMSVECEETGVKKIALGFKAKTSKKWVLPMKSDKAGALQYKLNGGSAFTWQSFDFKEGKKEKKSFTTKDFIKE